MPQTQTATTRGGESFAALFEESLKRSEMRAGEVITAEVVRVDYNFVVVNAGLKSEAYVPIEEFKNDQGELEVQVGDFVSVAIDALENGYGDTILSRDKAKRLASWLSLENSLESGDFVTGTVNGKVKGGLTVLVNGIRAFLPGSLLDTRPVKDMSPFEGKTHGVQGHQARPQAQQRGAVAPRGGRGLDGRRARQAARDAARRRHRATAWSRTSPSTARSSTWAASTACCTSPTWPGAACATRARWCRSARNCTAKVLKFDAEKNRVSLGLKQLGDDPWHGVSRRYPTGTRLFGKVTNIADYGAFVEIEPGIEGLVHVSEMDWTNKNVAPSKLVTLGDEVEVMVLEIDEDKRRISLGMKQCKANPWEEFAGHRQARRQGQGPGQVDHRLRRVRRPGAGIDGLVHLSDLCWNEPGETAVRNYKKGQEVEADRARPSTSSASASAWASSSSTATRSPASPRSTTAARWSPARSRRSTRAAPRSSSTTTSPATCAPARSAATASKTRATC